MIHPTVLNELRPLRRLPLRRLMDGIAGRFPPLTEERALWTVQTLAIDRLVAVNHCGEHVTDRSHAARNAERYRTLLRRFSGRPAGKVELSIRPSEMGAALPFDGELVALDNLRLICQTAVNANATVTVEAEDHTTTDSTLSIVQDLRMDFPGTAATLQARLRRTRSDCADIARPGTRVRLCKGAHNEPATVAYQDGPEVDASYVNCLKTLIKARSRPLVATHDHRLIRIARHLMQSAGFSPGDYEFQMLHTARKGLQQQLIDHELGLRVYVPYGPRSHLFRACGFRHRPALHAVTPRPSTR